ncbi:ankyrin repeat domain-containing protein 50 [Biomphalaria pfeifferi]|uniref:Ankyrin repeat domain-containing protein 50 n=1 Tax=Biomphalaria pfeifferi TaxID=112525 RepID=A0AAD8C707_BIOPF|nr:ankyrin repeat domain-containing protein 50 [Biomphalaria pfeifferi]
MASPDAWGESSLCSPAAGIFIHATGHSGTVGNFYKLAKVILTSDDHLLTQLLDLGFDPDSRDEDGNTPLMIAVREGNKNAINILIDHCANVNACNNSNESPLKMAACAGSPWTVALLLKNNGDPNITDIRKETALIQAVKQKNTDIVRILLNAGADINVTDQYGLTAVFYAVSSGVLELVKILLQAGGNPNVLDRYRCNSLIRAADAGKDEIVAALLNSKAEVHVPNKSGDTALIFASQFCSVPTVWLLLNAGSKINHRNDRGVTALHVAADRGRADVIKLLVEMGADVNAQKLDGSTALMCGARISCDVVKALIEAKAGLDVTNYSGHTALLIAATWGSFETVVALVEAGANVNVLTKDGETAIMSAARFNRNRAVEYLLKSGAWTDVIHKSGSLNTVLTYACQFCLSETVMLLLESRSQKELLLHHANAQGHTAFTYACMADRPTLVSFLVAAGLDANVRTISKDTPLILASHYAGPESIKCLIKGGADVNAANKNGVTPLLNAVKRNKLEVVKALLWNGAEIVTELHLATLQGYQNIVQLMVQSGASPTIINTQMLFDEVNSHTSYGITWSNPNVQALSQLGMDHSPLSMALLAGHWDLARFFLRNWFLTFSDCTHLPYLKAFRHYLTVRNMSECLQILEAMSSQPWRLLILSFAVASKALGHGSDRALKIQKLKLPPMFERRFQFRDITAFYFPVEWTNFSMDEIS